MSENPEDTRVVGGGFHSLEQLFGSRTRVKLLNLFLMNPSRSFFVRELTREVSSQINSVRRELINLEKLGLIIPVVKAPEPHTLLREKKFYELNKIFLLTGELAALFTKARVLMERDLINQVSGLGNIDYFVLTGFFVGLTTATDMLLVGKVDKNRLAQIVSVFEKDLRREINYTLMTPPEFHYRKEITDKFLYDVLVNKKIEVINKINAAGRNVQKNDPKVFVS